MQPTLSPEKLVDGAHPGGVALGQIVVDGDDMHALAGERVEIDGERGDQRLAFAGLHFGDAAVIQHHAADQLHVEMALADGALGGFAHGGEGLGDQIVERRAGADPGAEVLGARAQRLVGEGRHLGLERIDLLDDGPVFLELAVVGRAEDFAGESAKGQHGCIRPLDRMKFPRPIPMNPRESVKKMPGGGRGSDISGPPSLVNATPGACSQSPTPWQSPPLGLKTPPGAANPTRSPTSN